MDEKIKDDFLRRQEGKKQAEAEVLRREEGKKQADFLRLENRRQEEE